MFLYDMYPSAFLMSWFSIYDEGYDFLFNLQNFPLKKLLICMLYRSYCKQTCRKYQLPYAPDQIRSMQIFEMISTYKIYTANKKLQARIIRLSIMHLSIGGIAVPIILFNFNIFIKLLVKRHGVQLARYKVHNYSIFTSNKSCYCIWTITDVNKKKLKS